jgi:hypothetical protein
MNYPNFRTSIPTEFLSSWYYAVRWARLALEERIRTSKDYGLATDYDELVLSRVESLESYLQATSDEYMDWLAQPVSEMTETADV